MKKLQLFFFLLIVVNGFGLTSVSAVTNLRFTPDPTLSVWSAGDLPKDDIEELLITASELYEQKKYDEALAICIKAAGLSPNDFRPHFLSGLVYMAQGKLKSGSESFAKAISLKPDAKQLYLLKARADYLRGAKEEAIAACRKALELDPASAEAYILIGDALRFDDKRRDEAIAAYRMAIKVKPLLPDAYEYLGNMLEEEKDEKGAEEAFRKAMETDPKHMAGRFALGRLLVEQGRLKEARAFWEGRTSDMDDTFPNFITLLERAEKLKQATDALAIKPNDPATLVQMGHAVMDGESWVVDDRQELAIEYFKKALKIKANFAPAQHGIVKAYIQLADRFDRNKRNVDEELAKLRKLDPKLAKEMEDYRKNYSGGLQGLPLKINQ